MIRQMLCFILFGYLSGSVLYAFVFARIFKKRDLVQNSRDGNPGTANAFLHGGFWCGACTLCCDVLKGFVPVYAFIVFETDMPEWVTAAVLAAPVIGHIFPVFYGFRGGKGVAVTFGSLLGLFPYSLPVILLAAMFIFLSVGLRISPHIYRTAAAYLCTAVSMFAVRVRPCVCIGFLIITGFVCLRLYLSKEEKEKFEVKLLWMR